MIFEYLNFYITLLLENNIYYINNTYFIFNVYQSSKMSGISCEFSLQLGQIV